MAEVEARWVTLSHGRTRYFAGGEGPPCILLHGVGYTAGGDAWWLNWGALSERLTVLAPDFMGWGLGDRFPREYSFAYLVDFVREFQDALGIERAHVVGHSMGGWVAALLAYESPTRVDRLVLVAPGGLATRTLRSMTEFEPPTLEAIRAQWAEHTPPGLVDLDAVAHRDFAKTTVPGALEAYRLILRHMNDPLHRQRYHLLRRLPHIAAPTLLIWGRKDRVNAFELAEEALRRLPRAQLVALDADHFVPTEVPEAFNRAVLEFLTAESGPTSA
ncbi:MAG: alpha/beta fold hydrolase [Firmicutes bacterium]|nr:alpha/beta fold hydrolase [Alicyclobacillaceae bacterium]MCL6496710.1 alpha/beta fold hydrolase [Bacillota bacterium]